MATLDSRAGRVEVADLKVGEGGVARFGRFAWVFEWLFDRLVEWLSAIKSGAGRPIARHGADRRAAVLPTSPRPSEAGS